MTRVEWTRYAGEDVESVVGIMLCRDNPDAERVRPSRGDGGIDVVVRQPDGWVVYQVKKYASNLTNRQKSAIKNSFARLRAYAQERNLTISKWHLVMPLSPTRENLEWLEGFTSDAEFPSVWSGLDFVDGLAASYPEVIDYYLRDGSERLTSALQEFSRATGLMMGGTPGGPITPDAARNGLASIHSTLNALDPGFRYDFSVDATAPALNATSNCIFVATDRVGDAFVTYRVYPKYRDVLADRPILLNMTMTATDEGTARSIRDFIEYGVPLDVPQGTVSISGNLPGGLLSDIRGASATIDPAAIGKSGRMRLQVVSDTGEPVSPVVDLIVDPPTRGLSGVGERMFVHDTAEVFDIEIRKRLDTGTTETQMRRHPISNRPASDVLHSVEFLHACKHPNKIVWGGAYGPVDRDFAMFQEVSSDELMPTPVTVLVRALSIVQGRTSVAVNVPPADTLTNDQLLDVLDAATLLTGGTITRTIPRLEVGLVDNPPPLGDVTSILVTRDHQIVIDGNNIDIGRTGIEVTENFRVVESQGDSSPSVVVLPVDRPFLRGEERIYRDLRRNWIYVRS